MNRILVGILSILIFQHLNCLKGSADKEKSDISFFIKDRKGTRAFSNKAVSEDQIKTFMEISKFIPSYAGKVPVDIKLVKKGTDEWNSLMDAVSEFNSKWVSDAPDVLIISTDKNAKQTPVHRGKFKKDDTDALEAGMTVMAILLHASYLGLNVHVFSDVDIKKIAKSNLLDKGHTFQIAVALGHFGDSKNLHKDLKGFAEQSRKEQIAKA